MNVLYPIAQYSIYIVMAISVIAAIGVVTLGNLFYAAVALVVVLVGTERRGRLGSPGLLDFRHVYPLRELYR